MTGSRHTPSIGVATGSTLCTFVGSSLRRSLVLYGTVVDTAKHLAVYAPRARGPADTAVEVGGGPRPSILVDYTTYRAVADTFLFERVTLEGEYGYAFQPSGPIDTDTAKTRGMCSLEAVVWADIDQLPRVQSRALKLAALLASGPVGPVMEPRTIISIVSQRKPAKQVGGSDSRCKCGAGELAAMIDRCEDMSLLCTSERCELHPQFAGSFAFCSPLLQNTVVRMMSAVQLRKLHHDIGQGMCELVGGQELTNGKWILAVAHHMTLACFGCEHAELAIALSAVRWWQRAELYYTECSLFHRAEWCIERGLAVLQRITEQAATSETTSGKEAEDSALVQHLWSDLHDALRDVQMKLKQWDAPSAAVGLKIALRVGDREGWRGAAMPLPIHTEDLVNNIESDLL